MAWYRTAARWLPLATAAVVAALTVALWWQLRQQEGSLLQRRTELQAVHLRHLLRGALDQTTRSLVRMANRWEIRRPDRADWEADAVLLVRDEGLQAVEWVDPSLRVRWIVPLEGNQAAAGADLAFEPRRRLAAEAARDGHLATISRSVELLQGQRGILVFAPIFARGGFAGHIVGVLRTDALLASIFSRPGILEYEVDVYDGEERIFRQESRAGPADPEWTRAVRLDLQGLGLQLRVTPASTFVRSSFSLSTAALGTGLAAAVLLALSARLARAAVFRARQTERARRALELEIAERRRAEAALKRSRDELEARVDERTASLREANERLAVEVEQRTRAQEALQLMLRERDHRVKNTLAMVQAVAQQTLTTTSSPVEFAAAFQGRLAALARIDSVLDGSQVPLAKLIELTVAPYRNDAGSLSIDGDAVPLPPRLVRGLGMAIHELATNAAKYGALSVPQGHVEVTVRALPANGARRLEMTWSERGGPPVTPPGRRGIGTSLIEEALAYELGGSAASEFAPGGVRWRISVPLPALEQHDV